MTEFQGVPNFAPDLKLVITVPTCIRAGPTLQHVAGFGDHIDIGLTGLPVRLSDVGIAFYTDTSTVAFSHS